MLYEGSELGYMILGKNYSCELGLRLFFPIPVILNYWVNRIPRFREPSSFGLKVPHGSLMLVHRMKE